MPRAPQWYVKSRGGKVMFCSHPNSEVQHEMTLEQAREFHANLEHAIRYAEESGYESGDGDDG